MAKRKTGVDPNAELRETLRGAKHLAVPPTGKMLSQEKRESPSANAPQATSPDESPGDQYQGPGADPSRPDPGPKMRWQVQAEEAEARARLARQKVAQERLEKQKAALAFVKGEAKVEAPAAPPAPTAPIILPAMRADLPQAEPDGDCCAVCRFGAAEEKGDQIFIHCRRHPPISVLTNLQRAPTGHILASETFSFFPILQPGAWCGDFEEGEPGIILPGLATKAQ